MYQTLNSLVANLPKYNHSKNNHGGYYDPKVALILHKHIAVYWKVVYIYVMQFIASLFETYNPSSL